MSLVQGQPQTHLSDQSMIGTQSDHMPHTNTHTHLNSVAGALLLGDDECSDGEQGVIGRQLACQDSTRFDALGRVAVCI